MRAQSMGLCDLSTASQKLLCSPRKAPRRISKVPFKVLDAPELQVCSVLILRDSGAIVCGKFYFLNQFAGLSSHYSRVYLIL